MSIRLRSGERGRHKIGELILSIDQGTGYSKYLARPNASYAVPKLAGRRYSSENRSRQFAGSANSVACV